MAADDSILKRVAQALQGVMHPSTGQDIVASGLVSQLSVDDSGKVSFRFGGVVAGARGLVDEARRAVASVEGVTDVKVETAAGRGQARPAGRKLPVVESAGEGRRTPPQSARSPSPASPPSPPQPQPIPGVRHVVAVSSGKGGVGKSTVATNLAAALVIRGHRVGLMDADVYGPDIPIMFGVHSRPGVTPDERVVPIEAFGVKLMSLGFLIDEDTPAIWRGPIVMGIIRQFLQQVEWGELDYLLVDMPPGTGDAQLSLVQLARVDGAVMVTTPQGVSVADVLKGIKMFERVEVPVLGLIENMSGFVCPHCGERTDIFGSGGGRKLAATAGIPFLGEVPLGSPVVAAGDAGRPTVVAAPDSAEAGAFLELADRVTAALVSSEESTGGPRA